MLPGRLPSSWTLGWMRVFWNNRLGLNFDYYIKDTKDWLLVAPMLDSFGTGAPFVNGDDVRNQGTKYH